MDMEPEPEPEPPSSHHLCRSQNRSRRDIQSRSPNMSCPALSRFSIPDVM